MTERTEREKLEMVHGHLNIWASRVMSDDHFEIRKMTGVGAGPLNEAGVASKSDYTPELGEVYAERKVAYISSDFIQSVDDAVMSLSRKQYEIINIEYKSFAIVRSFAKLTQSDKAELIGIELSDYKQTLRRARLRVADEMGI